MHVADSMEVRVTKFARAVFRNPVFDLRSMGQLFHTLVPSKDAVSIPYLTERIFLDFSLSSFLRAYGYSTISNTSFIISGAKFIFTLKIYVTSF